MRLLIVNPNASEAMTHRIAAVARAQAGPGIEVIARTNTAGPQAIEGARDGAMAVPGLLALLEAEPFDAGLVACFDDTGLDAARERAIVPILGLGAASFHLAAAVARRFTVVTTTAASVPVIEENILRLGLGGRCAGVAAAGIRVLDLETDRAAAVTRIVAVARETARRGDVVVLGCAGMAGLASEIAGACGIPAIDPVIAGVALAVGAMAAAAVPGAEPAEARAAARS
ncbi:aspartate/glutamate racemase family protein [Limibaculum sp. FT325]|uniref:aspartate/glutamate racemase family protein n=1 Tax=Thermohalobaculum sediminis TaxID=2939436 RepID=UPI0020BF70C9|nr:aspartate/glutamate racemase family protein [Limibaculum sediminis]MCL5777184.1 aspartate/glutamate racemase family protein [Limibaculum sediminis]